MPFVDNIKTVFIHVPKTGGSSVEVALAKFGKLQFRSAFRKDRTKYGHSPQHCTLKELSAEFPNRLKNFKIIAIYRDPIDRCISDYNYEIGHLCHDYTSFDDFLDQYLSLSEEALDKFDNHQLPTKKYIEDANGNVSDKVVVFKYSPTVVENIGKYLFKDPEKRKKFKNLAELDLTKKMSGLKVKRMQRKDLSELQIKRIRKFFQEDYEIEKKITFMKIE